MNKKYYSPIFVFGTGRSGTTIFYEILSRHEEVAWTSHLCNFFPERLYLQRALMRSVDLPVAGEILRRLFKPVEVYRFWDHYFPGFSLPYRDLLSSDMTPHIKRRLEKPMPELTTTRRSQLVHKITGWPRVGFLAEAFEEAKFIHVVRDGRAVANSMLNIDFWDGWQGPQKWLYGSLPEPYLSEWKSYDESFVALAAVLWKMLMDAAEKALSLIDEERWMYVKYEELCEKPEDIFKKTVDFCALKWSNDFENSIDNFKLLNNNKKYLSDLSEVQIDILEEILHDYLVKYDYKKS
jgi:hypothetical protein